MPLVPAPNVYEVICEMFNTANPNFTWRNTWEFHNVTTPVSSDAFWTSLSGFQRALIMNDCTLKEMRCYKWVRGGPNPYPNGLPLFTVPVNAVGTGNTDWTSAAAGDPLTGEIVLRIDRVHSGQGKPGHLFVRGLLHEGDVNSVSGGRVFLSNTSTYSQANLAAIMVSKGLDQSLEFGTSPYQLCVQQYSAKHGTLGNMNQITGLILIGASINKRTRKSKK